MNRVEFIQPSFISMTKRTDFIHSHDNILNKVWKIMCLNVLAFTSEINILFFLREVCVHIYKYMIKDLCTCLHMCVMITSACKFNISHVYRKCCIQNTGRNVNVDIW